MKQVLALAGVAVLASACIIVDAEREIVTTDLSGGGGGASERLYAASVDADGVVIRAPSNGCTSEDSFDARVRKRGDNSFEVRFVRTREDYCRANMPEGVELRFARSELGLPSDAQISITNAIGR